MLKFIRRRFAYFFSHKTKTIDEFVRMVKSEGAQMVTVAAKLQDIGGFGIHMAGKMLFAAQLRTGRWFSCEVPLFEYPGLDERYIAMLYFRALEEVVILKEKLPSVTMKFHRIFLPIGKSIELTESNCDKFLQIAREAAARDAS